MADEKFQSRFVGRLLVYALSRGAEVDSLIARFDLPQDAASVPSVDITMETLRQLGAAVAALLNDPFLGMSIARSPHNRIGGTAEVVFANCATIADTWVQLERLQRLFSPSTKMEVLRSAHEVAIEYSVPGDPRGTGRENSEWWAVRAIEGVRTLSRKHIVPSRVWFSHEPRESITPLVDYFGTGNIYFGAEREGVALEPEIGTLPTVNANPTIFSVAEKLATGEIAALDPNVQLLSLVRAKIRGELENGAPSLDAIARHLGMSDRTLQRRIRELGASFQSVVEEERRDLAMQWVKDERMDLDTLPATLGYGQKEAFWRAFKRWTGTTPVRFRKDMRASS